MELGAFSLIKLIDLLSEVECWLLGKTLIWTEIIISWTLLDKLPWISKSYVGTLVFAMNVISFFVLR